MRLSCQSSGPPPDPSSVLGELVASLAAEVGVIAFKTAYARWVSAPDEYDLAQLIREALDQLKGLIAGE